MNRVASEESRGGIRRRGFAEAPRAVEVLSQRLQHTQRRSFARARTSDEHMSNR